MEKEHNLPNKENTKIELKDLSADDLKDRFKAGSIPLQTDYKHLIDMADIGRKATGQAPGQADNPNSALKLDEHGRLVIKAGNGITVDENGIKINPDQVFPKGMIVMFSGSENEIPPGWAFCDGGNYNGILVPDLRNRFIMCGETFSEKGESSKKADGSKNEKNFFKDTESTTVSVNVEIKDTTLNISQIPKHNHVQGLPYHSDGGFGYSHIKWGKTEYRIDNTHSSSLWHTDKNANKKYDDLHPHTSEVGEGKGHNHSATASSSPHSHKIDVVPPYYLLAFIIKL
ncbi:phage tail protein [Photorhabdus heterorhabditis]|uniref:phage tail protein n=1 Tax=Photorhabdus heterorhabditis TaxID=880156 RepID=UPI00156208D4|nr:phage tail protein [Photorhabdus heterorhabditis]NRN27579.1 tail fiber protein [Photorhabdus heterorhabditis subsp. aluminescens]